jgi:hypothetical protein
MYLLYVDESGGATETDQEIYVLGGISVHERKPYFLSKELDDLQERWFPNATDPIEFHASHIRNGKGEPWESMGKPERLRLMNEMCQLLTKTSDAVSLFAVAMHKPSFPKQDPIHRTCEEMAGHFDALLTSLETRPNADKERGLMIFDQSAHQKTLHSLVAEYRSSGASWGGKVKHLAEIPMFTDSKLTRMLQWADFVAYAVFRRYQHADSSFLDRIVGKFQHSGGILHGLVHLSGNRQECYCPACATRRVPPRIVTATASA